MSETDRLLRIVRARQAEKAGEPSDQPAEKPDYSDLVPDIDSTYERTAEDIDLDRKLKDFPIVDAYTRWIPKAPPKDTARTESIMVSCPRPDHPDAHPSAWMNSDRNVGACGVCPSTRGKDYWGFDPYDLFAIHIGFNVDSYRTDGSFSEVRRLMAEDLGYQVIRSAAGKEFVVETEPETPSEPAESPEDELATVLPFIGLEADRDPSVPFSGGTIDWRTILDHESRFLRPWMEICTDDDLPEEFYFWLGLVGIGLACGNDFLLADRTPVRSNLMVCLVGSAGLGKSRSTNALEDLLLMTFPDGVRLVPEPGSGEALIDSFVNKDESGELLPVRGLLKIGELASLANKSARTGNTIKQYMQDLFDSSRPVRISSRSAKNVEASGHFCSVVSTTQPKMLPKLLSQDDASSGFVSRWVFVTGIPKPLIPIGGKRLNLEPVRKPLADIRSFASRKDEIKFDTDGGDLWVEFFRRELEPLKHGGSDVFARTDLLMKKLMLLLAADKQQRFISSTTVEQAVALWPYLKKVYGLVDEKTTTSERVIDQTDLEDRVKGAIRDLEPMPQAQTLAFIKKQMGYWGKKATREDIEKAVKNLEKSGEVESFVRPRPAGTKGRPPVGFEYRIAR